LSIPVTLVTWVYINSVNSRYAIFTGLRDEALKIVRAINFIQEKDGVHISDDE